MHKPTSRRFVIPTIPQASDAATAKVSCDLRGSCNEAMLSTLHTIHLALQSFLTPGGQCSIRSQPRCHSPITSTSPHVDRVTQSIFRVPVTDQSSLQGLNLIQECLYLSLAKCAHNSVSKRRSSGLHVYFVFYSYDEAHKVFRPSGLGDPSKGSGTLR